jgi:hypothetical protein
VIFDVDAIVYIKAPCNCKNKWAYMLVISYSLGFRAGRFLFSN